MKAEKEQVIPYIIHEMDSDNYVCSITIDKFAKFDEVACKIETSYSAFLNSLFKLKFEEYTASTVFIKSNNTIFRMAGAVGDDDTFDLSDMDPDVKEVTPRFEITIKDKELRTAFEQVINSNPKYSYIQIINK